MLNKNLSIDLKYNNESLKYSIYALIYSMQLLIVKQQSHAIAIVPIITQP